MPQEPDNNAHDEHSLAPPSTTQRNSDQGRAEPKFRDAPRTRSGAAGIPPTNQPQQPERGLPSWTLPEPTRSSEATRNIAISALVLAVAMTVAVGGLALYSITRAVETVNGAQQLSADIATAQYPDGLTEPDDQSDQDYIAEQSRKRPSTSPPTITLFPQTPAPTEVGSGPGPCSTTALGREGGRVSIEAGTLTCPNATAVIRKAYNDLGPGGGLLKIDGVASWLCTGVTTNSYLSHYQCETPMGDHKVVWTTNR